MTDDDPTRLPTPRGPASPPAPTSASSWEGPTEVDTAGPAFARSDQPLEPAAGSPPARTTSAPSSSSPTAASSPRPRDVPMATIAGVRLRPGGRVIACHAANLPLEVGTRVIIQADRGMEIGIVTLAPTERPNRGRVSRVVRIADERDRDRARAEDERAADALAVARETAATLKLPVKMFHAELHGGGRATMYFASDARVDFRDLVRDLGTRLRLRVEMRQVGVRDEAKMVGGIGSCGRELCCSTFLPRFAPVSIKAAKVQNIALTPSKVSGQCGRLKCCLVYEEANYIEASKSLPRVGKRVATPDGVGRVGDLDVLRGRVRVLFQDTPPKVYTAGEVKPAE
jgi:cell fate regulator YaaT (PSP1 superfamily)